MFEKFWHRTLGVPYQLAKPVDQGEGRTVVLLHGLGSSTRFWQHVVERLAQQPYRTVAFDLLGFGDSPKPDWLDYDIDDHAKPVIAAIEQLNPQQPVILVGHSMGCLIAVRIARQRPDLVKHLILYEMPLYKGLPEKRLYRLRLELYYRLFEKVIAYKPSFDSANARLIERIGQRIAGFRLDKSTWLSFTQSLKHTIMNQTASEDIKHLKMPMDVIYGSYDMLVIQGKPKKTFGGDLSHVSAHKVRSGHSISEKTSKFIVERILASEQPIATQIAGKKVLSRAKRATKRA